jgi:glycosyltransferase involved in cell wall biosynthesis
VKEDRLGDNVSGGNENGPSGDYLVSVVIPARNEATFLRHLIPRIKECLSRYQYEIIVVDDGSTDGTGDVARANHIKVVCHEKSLGKGAAMKAGAKYASGRAIVFLDGDGAHDPQEVPKVADAILQGRADLVIGSRALPGHKVPVAPVIRRFSNNLASFFISVIISFFLPLVTMFRCPLRWTRITDCTSGFRAIRKESWQKLNLMSQGFQIETEMLYEAARNKLTIVEVPISCNWNSQISRLFIVRDGLKTLKLLAGKLLRDIGESAVTRTLRKP